MTKKKIKELAIEAGLPPGWYNGPWFDDKDRLRTDMPDCLVRFVRLIEAGAKQSGR